MHRPVGGVHQAGAGPGQDGVFWLLAGLALMENWMRQGGLLQQVIRGGSLAGGG